LASFAVLAGVLMMLLLVVYAQRAGASSPCRSAFEVWN
jgi:hypothetical protein